MVSLGRRRLLTLASSGIHRAETAPQPGDITGPGPLAHVIAADKSLRLGQCTDICSASRATSSSSGWGDPDSVRLGWRVVLIRRSNIRLRHASGANRALRSVVLFCDRAPTATHVFDHPD